MLASGAMIALSASGLKMSYAWSLRVWSTTGVYPNSGLQFVHDVLFLEALVCP